MFAAHEQHKQKVHDDHWRARHSRVLVPAGAPTPPPQCLYCDKSFYSEAALDGHLGARHAQPPTTAAPADVCLADYCDVLGCASAEAALEAAGPGRRRARHASGAPPPPPVAPREEPHAPCTSRRLVLARARCEAALDACFAPAGAARAPPPSRRASRARAHLSSLHCGSMSSCAAFEAAVAKAVAVAACGGHGGGASGACARAALRPFFLCLLLLGLACFYAVIGHGEWTARRDRLRGGGASPFGVGGESPRAAAAAAAARRGHRMTCFWRWLDVLGLKAPRIRRTHKRE